MARCSGASSEQSSSRHFTGDLTRALGQRSGLAAILSVLIVVIMVIVPLMFIASSLLIEATGLYETLQSGKVDVGQYLGAAGDALPGLDEDPSGPFRP